MRTSNNPNHKYWVCDMNGFRRATATTRKRAGEIARYTANATGLDMNVCFRERHTHHVIRYRTQNRALLNRRRILQNGQYQIQ